MNKPLTRLEWLRLLEEIVDDTFNKGINMTANNKQVGGKHYQTEGSIQHWDIVYEYLEGDYLLGNATKYIFRCGKKGGRTKAIEDLEKAIHYLEKAVEKIKEDRDSVNDGEPTTGYVNQD